jgi:methylmalonyl-CoA mutase C-terminal domain/subunit
MMDHSGIRSLTQGIRLLTEKVERDPSSKRLRIIIAKPGLDGHDKGALVVARALRDAGFEVIYLGLYRRIEEIVESAIQEGVDFIGLSILSGTHLKIAKKLVREVRKRNCTEIKTVIGGIIPSDDVSKLRRIGISIVIPTGTPISEIPRILKEANHS